MSRGIKRKLQLAMDRVQADIRISTDRSNKFSVGLAHEGYKGGYLDALNDVLLALNGVQPRTRGYWDEPER